jgi:hypothetical protein
MSEEAVPKESEGSAPRKKRYAPPAIVHSAKIEARAILCSKAEGSCTFGPASS